MKILLWLLLASPARADINISPNAGTTSAAFLEVAVGARPVAMGEAFTAVAGDANGLLWNPASIAAIGTHVLSATHNESFESIRSDYAAYVHPLVPTKNGERRSLALHVLTLIPPGQDSRTGANENDAFNPITAPDGTFGAYNVALGATYAQELGRSWTVGGTFQLIRESIATYSATTIGVNLGALRETAVPGLTLGASLLNFGPGNKFIDTAYPLPLTLRLGAAYRPSFRGSGRDKLLLTADASFPNNDYPWLAAGAEWTPLQAISLRAGYRYRINGDPLGGLSGFRVGAGFKISEVRLDYAFAPFGDLGSQHRISITIPWGRAPEPPKTPEAALPIPAMPSLAAPPLPLPAAPVPAAAFSTAPASGYAVWTRMSAVTPQGMIFEVKASTDNPDAVIRQATFRTTLLKPETLEFDVHESTEPPPASVLPSSCTVYRSLEIRTSQAPVRAPVLRLAVDSAWLKAHGLSADKVVMFRIEDGKALAQVTQPAGEAEGRSLYDVRPETLSAYWIVAVVEPPKPEQKP